MSVLFLLVPIALVLVGIALAAYVWAVRRGQFDDLTTPAIRALHEDRTQAGTRNDGQGGQDGPSGGTNEQ